MLLNCRKTYYSPSDFLLIMCELKSTISCQLTEHWWWSNNCNTGIWLVQTICCHRLPVASVCVCRWHRRLDAGESSAVKYRQDWPTLVRDFSSSSSAAHFKLSGSGPTSSSRRPQSEISESTSTPTSACNATFRKQLPTASPFYANCAVSDGQFQRQYTTRSSSLSSCHGSTTAMLCWWAYQPTCTSVCSQCSTLLRDPSPVYDAPTTSPTHSPVSTGWRSRSLFS